jgi:hypothetical protein
MAFGPQDNVRPIHYTERPEYGYDSVLGEDGRLPDDLLLQYMGLSPEFQGKLDAIQLDSRGLDAFRDRALSQGPSAWALAQNKRSRAEQKYAMDDMAQALAGQAATSRSALAMKGGLSSGAAQSLARDQMRATMMAKQQNSRSGITDRLNTGAEDERMRMQALQALPGMEIAALQPEMQKAQMWAQMQQFDKQQQQAAQQFNLGNQFTAWQNDQKASVDKHAVDTQAWAAQQDAEVQRYGIDKEDDDWTYVCTELFRRGLATKAEIFKLYGMLAKSLFTRADFIGWYFRHGKKLVIAGNQAEIDWSYWKPLFIDAVLAKLAQGDLVGAQNAYGEAARSLNIRLGRVAPDWKNSYLETGLLKSLKAVPAMLALKGCRNWLSKVGTTLAKQKLAQVYGG